MEYIPVQSDSATFTPDIARYVLNHYSYPKQRKLSPRHVLKIKTQIDNGHFNPLISEFTFVKCPGYENGYALINGQHRMTAIASSCYEVESSVKVIDVKSTSDADDIYSLFDTGVRARSNGGIIINAVTPSKELPVTVLNKAMKVVPIVQTIFETDSWEVANKFLDAQEVVSLIKDEYIDTLKGFWQAIVKADRFLKPRLLSVGTMTIAVLTFRSHAAEAREFWREVAERPTTKTDPRYALESYFRENPRPKRPELDGKYCAAAWNAMVSNEKITSRLKINSSGVIHLFGVKDIIRLRRLDNAEG